MTARRRSAPEVIATLFGWDIADVTEQRYWPTRYRAPALYSVGSNDMLVCAPSGNQKPPQEYRWREIGEAFDRKVYESFPPDA